ncbi:hypothetical protein SAMN05444162_0687 [Paenibacillaceae bacterium GAS479]|nr:hypothetical protein SAMN05444162_0687 [Paenibacillaceae bacterium GAS479]
MEEQNKAINSRGGLLTGEPTGSEEASGEMSLNTSEAAKVDKVEDGEKAEQAGNAEKSSDVKKSSTTEKQDTVRVVDEAVREVKATEAEQVEAWAVSGAAAANSELDRPPEWQVFYDAVRQAAGRMRR